jgi:sulfur-carrier protein
MIVKLVASIRETAGTSRVEPSVAPGTSVRAGVERMGEHYPVLSGRLVDEHGALRDAVSIFADGRSIRLAAGFDTPMRGDEELAIFPPVAGGCG